MVGPALFTKERGVIAGGALATYELKLLVVRGLVAFTARWPRCDLNLHIDDLACGGENEKAKILAAELGQQAKELRRIVTVDLRLVLADEKATMTAGDAETLKLVEEATEGRGGKPEQTIRKLGVDYAYGGRGARGTQKVRRDRLKKAKRRLRQAKLLFEKRQGRGKMFTAGVLPAFEFGADITGVAPSLRRGFAARAAGYLGIGGRGAKPGLAWQLAARGA